MSTERLGFPFECESPFLFAVYHLEQTSHAILSTERLGFPFECESPFLFAVYHLDHYPRGDANLGPASSLAGHSIGADFGNKAGWNMYHGEKVPGFPKHPHRGFETMTITRQGWIDHADSLGNSGRFGGGDVQWMTAARGICHGEMFPLLNQDEGNTLELFQVWVNLPKRSKMVEPGYRMFWLEDIPRLATSGTEEIPGCRGAFEVVLIAGELPGLTPPPAPPPNSYAVDPASDFLVLTLKLSPGAAWTLPAYAGPRPLDGLHRNLYFFAGSGAVIDGQSFTSHKRVKTRPDAEVLIEAGTDAVEVLVLQGRDIGEPVVQHGPFVMSSRAEISQAFQDYQETGFGKWKFSSDAVVHRRDAPRFMRYSDGTSEERPRP